MRIIFHRGPLTPSGYLPRLFVFTLLPFFGVWLLLQIALLINHTGPNSLPAFIYSLCAPVTDRLLRWSGTGLNDAAMGGFVSLFILMFLRPVYIVGQMTMLKLQNLRVLEESYGPLTRPQHHGYMVAATMLLFGAIALPYVPLPLGELDYLLYASTRVSLFMALTSVGIALLVVGLKLRESWLQTQPKRPAKGKTTKAISKLKLAIDNTVPAATAPRNITLPSLASEGETGIFVAITAELVQACGRLNAMPTPEQLIQPLEMMQKAASLTRSSQYYHPDLKGACAQACQLLQEGKLKALPSLAAAQALYKKPDKTKLNAVARELREKVHTTH